MVPEHWKEGKVADLVAALESGVSVNGEDRARLDGEKAVLKVSAVSYGFFDESACKVINGTELNRAKTSPKSGQIIISRSNTEGLVGASVYLEKDYDYLYLPDKLWQTVAKPGANMKWLSYVLASSKVRYTLSNFATGTSGSMKNITKGELLSLRILIPPIEEQNKIAKILSIWDKAIALTQQLIILSQQRKNGLMQQLLTGKLRFPGFGGKWKSVHLAEICAINPKKSACPPDGVVSFVPMDAVSEDARLLRHEKRQYSDVAKGFTAFRDHDVLVAKITPCFENGKGAYVNGLYNSVGFGSTEFHVLRAKPSTCSLFIYYLTNRVEFRVRGEANMQGSAGQKRVPTDYLKTLNVSVPQTLEEQQKIASVLSLADREIETQQQKLEYFKSEKKALMQQLLTGKLRVKVDGMEIT